MAHFITNSANIKSVKTTHVYSLKLRTLSQAQMHSEIIIWLK